MQRFPQLLSIFFAERREKPALDVLHHLRRLAEDLVTGGGDLHDVPAPVLPIRTTFHETLAFQHVDEGDHRGAIDVQLASGLLLGQRGFAGEQCKDGELAAVDLERVQRRLDQFHEVKVSVLQEKAEAIGEGRRRPRLLLRLAVLSSSRHAARLPGSPRGLAGSRRGHGDPVS